MVDINSLMSLLCNILDNKLSPDNSSSSNIASSISLLLGCNNCAIISFFQQTNQSILLTQDHHFNDFF